MSLVYTKCGRARNDLEGHNARLGRLRLAIASLFWLCFRLFRDLADLISDHWYQLPIHTPESVQETYQSHSLHHIVVILKRLY